MIILYIIVLILSVILIGAIIYLISGFGKRLFHDIFGWHMPANEKTFDGCSFHCTCKYCGKHIMQDSQGNWY